MTVVAKCLYRLQEGLVNNFASLVVPHLLAKEKFNRVITTTGADPDAALARLQELTTPGSPKLPFISISRLSMTADSTRKNSKRMMDNVNGVNVYTREVELSYNILYCDDSYRDVDDFSEFCILMLEGFHSFSYLVDIEGKPVEIDAQYSIVPTDKPEYFGTKKEYAYTSLVINVVTTITTGKVVESVLGTVNPVLFIE